MTRTNLQCRRISAYCLNSIIKQHHLGNKAITLLPDQFEDWEVKSDWEIFALQRKRMVAEIYLTFNTAHIIITNWFDLIREEHYADFQPHLHNIEIDTRETVLGEPYPDGNYEMDFDQNRIPGFDLPEQRMPRHVGGRRPRVICSR